MSYIEIVYSNNCSVRFQFLQEHAKYNSTIRIYFDTDTDYGIVA